MIAATPETQPIMIYLFFSQTDFSGGGEEFPEFEVVVSLLVVVVLVVFGDRVGGQLGEFVGHVCKGFLVFAHDWVGVNEKGVGVVSSHVAGLTHDVK